MEQQGWGNLQINWAMVVGCFLLASFVDRVLIQAVTRTTLGKAVFGLVVIDRDTGAAIPACAGSWRCGWSA